MMKPKKPLKKEKYFLEMLDAERQYRRQTGGEDCDKPFITPVLFSLLDSLEIYLFVIIFLLGAIFGCLLI